jgi:hypothetical protein
MVSLGQLMNNLTLFSFAMDWHQGDQKCRGKFAPRWGKVAKTVAKPKNAKTFSSKINLKAQIIFIKPLLTS